MGRPHAGAPRSKTGAHFGLNQRRDRNSSGRRRGLRMARVSRRPEYRQSRRGGRQRGRVGGGGSPAGGGGGPSSGPKELHFRGRTFGSSIQAEGNSGVGSQKTQSNGTCSRDLRSRQKEEGKRRGGGEGCECRENKVVSGAPAGARPFTQPAVGGVKPLHGGTGGASRITAIFVPRPAATPLLGKTVEKRVDPQAKNREED